MDHCLSRAVIFEGIPITEQNQRRTSTPTTTTTTTNHNAMTTSGAGCSADHCHGCNCGCRTCSCPAIPVRHESDRGAYARQRALPIPSPHIEFHDCLSPCLSSIGTDDACGLNGESFNNSWEVHDYFNARLTARNLTRHQSTNMHADRTQHEDDDSMMDEDNENPWPDFLDRVDSLGHMSPMAEDSSGMIMLGNMDDSSMLLECGGRSNGDVSASSRELSSSRQSVTASQILRGAGAVFAN
ncbi:hypothetical protein A1O3_06357 [Capronia epimyces CBS 606.96]|uniref:Uncharacterized protein n=1 Tax=Capronia epimyces CBS 606.96 TaxID=1182542 RepID=W9YJV2_9EURO|nr:uncharacterized protein A1O3_06357 [Capronia epimyces CBS 606.96]EXJ82544.1 hypothetical protein A1O3_06357 [Capronia epimyces CBS 606.96]